MYTDIFTTEEIKQFRADTPGTNNVVHLNNAGASLPVTQTLDTVIAYLQEEAHQGGYETEAKYAAELNHTYALIAELINSTADEIALVENASAGWCIAFHGIDFKEGDEVLVSELEYVTNMIGFLNAEKLYGVKLVVIPNDENGNFSLSILESAISDRTKLIAVTHVASATGAVLPVEAIGKIAAKHHILYLLDACQSVGQMPVDVKAIGCHFLSVTGRKYLRAPRGTGFLYVKQDLQPQLKTLFIDGHSIEWITEKAYQPLQTAKRFEFYEKNRALTLGLGRAVSYALNIGLARSWQRIHELAAHLRQQLGSLPGASVHDYGNELCGIVTFSIKGIDAQRIKQYLSTKQINVSVGLAKSTLLFMNRHQLESVIRVSVHYYNTQAELDQLYNELLCLNL